MITREEFDSLLLSALYGEMGRMGIQKMPDEVPRNMSERIWPLIEKLQQELACDVCAGTGTPPAEICACRGTNNIHEVLLTVRQEYARLQQENAEWAAVHEGRVKQIRELARDAQKAEQENADLHTLLNDACKVLEISANYIAEGYEGIRYQVRAMAQRIADKIGGDQMPVRVTVQLHPDVVDALKSQAEVEGITPTELLRRLIGGDK